LTGGGLHHLAYLLVFTLPALEQRQICPGLILLVPTLALLAFDLAARRRSLGPAWSNPAFILGLVSGLSSGIISLTAGIDQPWSAVTVFLAYAVFLAGLAWLITT
jgi:uncharacterized membrane protein (GlpM family)